MSEPNVSVLAVNPQTRLLSQLQTLERGVLGGSVQQVVIVAVDAQGQLSLTSACKPERVLWLLEIAKSLLLPARPAASVPIVHREN